MHQLFGLQLYFLPVELFRRGQAVVLVQSFIVKDEYGTHLTRTGQHNQHGPLGVHFRMMYGHLVAVNRGCLDLYFSSFCKYLRL